MSGFKIRASIVCPKCRREMFYYPDEVYGNTIYCDGCGAEIMINANDDTNKEHIICDSCGEDIAFDPAEIDGGFIFCTKCGKKYEILDYTKKNTKADAPFENCEEKLIAEEAEKLVEDMRKPTSIGSPFSEVSASEELDDEAVMAKIHKRTAIWRESIRDTSNNKSAFTDNFAQGMPKWDLTPPDFVVRRKSAKAKNK